jgi:hypothetical protein
MLRELEVWEMEEVVGGGCPPRYRWVCDFFDGAGKVATGFFLADGAQNSYNWLASNACSIATAHGSPCGGAAGGGGSDSGSGGASKLF